MFKSTRLCLKSLTSSPLVIGDLQLSSNVILSPLERISDVGFRRLCFQNGAALTWTEMVYASELVRPSGSSQADLQQARQSPRGGRGADLIDTHDPSTLTGVQLIVDRTTARDNWGKDLLQKALAQLEEGAATDRPEWNNICAVDLNFGCPAPAISRRGAGPAQLRRRSKIRALFEVLHEWKQSTSLSNIKAIGAKIRLGNNAREQHFQVYLPVTEAAADTLDYLTIHARHGEQRSRDPPTWEAIAEIKQSLDGTSSNLKIIANGDIRTPLDVARIQEMTGCHGVMIGRAAMRNPWCFSRLAASKDTETSEWPTPEQVQQVAQENETWSSPQPAAARYQRFRHENFERLQREAVQAHTPERVPVNETRQSVAQTNSNTNHSDWYAEWSQAATRRRHLDKLDDEHETQRRTNKSSNNLAANNGPNHEPPASSSSRRRSNSRAWKERQKRANKVA